MEAGRQSASLSPTVAAAPRLAIFATTAQRKCPAMRRLDVVGGRRKPPQRRWTLRRHSPGIPGRKGEKWQKEK